MMLLSLPLAMSQPTNSVSRVRQWLTADATMLPSSACSSQIHFQGDLPGCMIDGTHAYSAAAATWRQDCTELLGPAFETKVLRLSQMSSSAAADEVAVRWRAQWSPASVRWLESLSQLFGWELERFDLDPKTESFFSWAAVIRLFATAATTRRLSLPVAVVEGRAVFTVDVASGLCVSHRESVDMVSLSSIGRLRNRRVAADAAEFLDIRRPPCVDSDVWAVEVAAAVLVGVPGAGTLDIEQLANEDEGRLALGIFALIILAASTSSMGSFGGGTGVFDTSPCDEVIRLGMGDYAFSQCVSDLFE